MLPRGRAQWAAIGALLEVHNPPVAVEIVALGEAATAHAAAEAFVGAHLVHAAPSAPHERVRRRVCRAAAAVAPNTAAVPATVAIVGGTCGGRGSPLGAATVGSPSSTGAATAAASYDPGRWETK